jgi:hypothetical protein
MALEAPLGSLWLLDPVTQKINRYRVKSDFSEIIRNTCYLNVVYKLSNIRCIFGDFATNLQESK